MEKVRAVLERDGPHSELMEAAAGLKMAGTLGEAERAERRREEAREIAVVKRAQKAGLNPKRATIGGVPMELGAPEPGDGVDAKPETLSNNPWTGSR